MIALGLLLLSFVGDNRCWKVEIELVGPLDVVRLDCGPDGETQLLGPFLAGEERRFEVPVPVRSPLGATALTSLPLPRVELVPAGSGIGPEAGSCRVVRWVEAREEEQLQRTARALLGRPRPPAATAPRVRAGPPELLLAAAGLVVLVRLRRRVAWQAGFGLALACVLAGLASRKGTEGEQRELVEVDLEARVAVRVTAARGELALVEHLEVRPEATRLEFVIAPGSTEARAFAPGATLYGIEAAPVPQLEPKGNEWQSLELVWTRSAAGEWNALGAWPRGEPMPVTTPRPLSTAARATAALEPPGWLAGALPPGVGVLVAVAGAGRWLRVVGFPPPSDDEAARSADEVQAAGAGDASGETQESVPGGD